MGIYLSRIFDSLFQTRPARICMVGIDGAGKTTILYKMKFNENIHTIPTIGFNVEEINFNNLSMTVWDVGGQSKIRPLWQHYFQSSDAVVFVVDSSDRERLAEASEELWSVLSDDRLRDACLLVLANKQDLPRAYSVSEITDKMNLYKLGQRQWFVQGTCAVNGDGILDGFSWLSNTIKSKPVQSSGPL
eukprot:maker-scaffold425_size175135-snap-gene-0.36 protein:Tk05822 transcript:maker-scaffold425_size175135-snap-gene-0.36-mRNA-1 annotation:"adp-ribosylation factor 1"